MKGFSLLEVMIAMAILFVSLLAISGLQGGGLRASGRAERMQLAVQLARFKMNENILKLEEQIEKDEFPDPREDKGEFEEYPGYWWTVKIDKVELPPVPSLGEGQGGTEQMVKYIGERLEKMIRVVRVTVFWEEIGAEQSFDLTSHVANVKAGGALLGAPVPE